MGITPMVEPALAPNLAWLDDAIGSSGTWLIVTTQRSTGRHRVRHELAGDIVAHLATAADPTARLTDVVVSLEAIGPQVGVWNQAHEDDRPLLDIDHVCLNVQACPQPFGDQVRFECWRLPARWVDPIRRATSHDMTTREHNIIIALVRGWQKARHREIGLCPTTTPGHHRRWAAAGPTILTALAARLELLPGHGVLPDHPHGETIEELASRTLAEHRVPSPFQPSVPVSQAPRRTSRSR